MAAQIRHLRLDEIALPGAHLAGAHGLTRFHDFAPDIKAWANGVFRTPLWPKIITQVAGWANTQSLDIGAQLECGVRYLDLPLCRAGERLCVYNALLGDDVYAVIEAVRAFVLAPGHEKEIVVLDFNRLVGVDPERHEELATALISAFGNMLVPATRGADTTLEALWRDGQSVIVSCDPVDLVRPNRWLWPRERIHRSAPNAQDATALKRALREIVEGGRPREGLWSVAAVLTPDESMIATGLGGVRDTLGEVAQNAAPTIASWIEDDLAGQPLNIIAGDFVDERFVDVVRSRNQPFAASSEVIPCTLGDAVYVLCYKPATGDYSLSRIEPDGRAVVTAKNQPRPFRPHLTIVPYRVRDALYFLQYDFKTGWAAIERMSDGGTGTSTTAQTGSHGWMQGLRIVPCHIGDDSFILQYAVVGERAGTARLYRMSPTGAARAWETESWWPGMTLMTFQRGRDTYALQYCDEGAHPGATNLYRLTAERAEWTWGGPSGTWSPDLDVHASVIGEDIHVLRYGSRSGELKLCRMRPRGDGMIETWPPEGSDARWPPGLTIVPCRLADGLHVLQYDARTGAAAIDRVRPGGTGFDRTFEAAAGTLRTGMRIHAFHRGREVWLLLHDPELGRAAVERLNPGGRGTTPLWR